MKTLETPRMVLRAFRPEDADDLYAYARDPAVGPAAGWRPHGSLEESRDILRMFLREDDVWAIELRATGRVVGSIGLHQDTFRRNSRCRSLGYVLARRHWGVGLMGEAVPPVLGFAYREMDLALVSVCHYPTNDRSRRVIERAGFRYEGTLRQAVRLFDGTLQDHVCYSLTREEWEQSR